MNHEHTHSHQHSHEHIHSEAPASSREELLALLSYMVSHNKHHAEELHDLAHDIGGETATLIHKAIDAFSEGNTRLEEALEHMQKGE